MAIPSLFVFDPCLLSTAKEAFAPGYAANGFLVGVSATGAWMLAWVLSWVPR